MRNERNRRWTGWAIGLALCGATACMAPAAITVDAYFRLGENDPGAAAGQPGKNPTLDVTGAKGLSIGAGTPTNSATVSLNAARVNGSSLSMLFDGTSYYTTNASLSARTDDHIIEAWFCQRSIVSGNAAIVSHGSAAEGYLLYLQDGWIAAGKEGSGFYGSDIHATAGVWYHVALVITSGVAQIYVNGVPAGASHAMGGNPPISEFDIGADRGVWKLDGYVDEVRLSHFNPGEFRATDLLCYPSEPSTYYTRAVLRDNPVAYWRLNELEGWSAFDMATADSPSAQQAAQVAIYHNTADTSTTERKAGPLTAGNGPRPGAFLGMDAGNTAPYFNGSTDNIRATLPAMGNDYSMETWIYNMKPATDQLTGYFLNRGINAYEAVGISGQFSFGHGAGRLYAYNGSNGVEGPTELATNTWYHVAFVRSGATVTIYLNGNVEASGTLTASADGSDFLIGSRPAFDWDFKGYIDETSIYNYALTADQVHEHYRRARVGPAGTIISIK